MSRTEQLNRAFAMAIDLTMDFHKSAFVGVSAAQVKARLRADMTKFEITEVLEQCGVSNARDVAQVIIATGNRLDR